MTRGMAEAAHEGSKVLIVALVALTGACSSTGTVKGIVVVTGATDNHAIVSIPGQSVQAGAGGDFILPAVPSGQVTVFATRDGYAPASQTVTVSSGGVVNVALTLNPSPVAPIIVGLTATPASVPPGGTVLLSSAAKSADGYPLHYSWTVPSGWTATGATDQSALTLTAPKQLGQSALVLLTVDDGHGASASASAAVATTDDMAPTASIVFSPSDPYVGSPVNLSAQVSTAGTQMVTYQWSLLSPPIGSSAMLSGTSEATATFKPDVAGHYGVQLIVTDASGLSSVPITADIPVVYGSPTAPEIKSISAMPSSPTVSEAISLTADVTDGTLQPLGYAWSLGVVPSGSTAELTGSASPIASFVPDVAGDYLAQLVVTGSNGVASPIASSWISVVPSPPTAVIAGTSPLAGVMNTALLLDGSGSKGTAGKPLSFTWTVAGWPQGSQCGQAGRCLAAQGSGTQTKFTPDAPGLFTVALTVASADQPITSTASVTVNVKGPAQLLLLSGDMQKPNARSVLSEALVVKAVAADGQTPIPNLPLTWITGANSTGVVLPNTNAEGIASAVVQSGRVAGAGSVKVYVTGQPDMLQSFTFDVQPAQPAAFDVALGQGTADTSAPLSIDVVDQFGNPSVTNSMANAATLTVTLSSSSGQATFGTATIGTLTPSATPGAMNATLVGGQFNASIIDPVAEEVQVNVTNDSGGVNLPVATSSTWLSDGGEAGFSNWDFTTTPSTLSGLGAWEMQNTVVDHGQYAFGVALSPLDELTTETTHLTDVHSLPAVSPNTNTVALLTFASRVDVTPVADTLSNCSASPVFQVGKATDAAGDGLVPVSPTSGYELTNNCGTVGASFGTTNGEWVEKTVDLTDSSTNSGYLSFGAAAAADANAPETAPSSWYVDDVMVSYFTPGTSSQVTATTTVLPGPPAAVMMATPTGNQGVVFHQCLNGQQGPYFVTVEEVDDHGNLSPGQNPVVQVTWTGETGTVTPISPALSGTIVSGAPNGLLIQLGANGLGQFEVNDSNSDDLTFVLDPLSSGFMANQAQVTVAPSLVHCHNDGLGGSWSDGAMPGTFNANEALYACENHYGPNACATNADFAYTTSPLCSSDIWTYSSWSTSGCSFASLAPGRESSVNDYSPQSCGGCGSASQTQNVWVGSGGFWN